MLDNQEIYTKYDPEDIAFGIEQLSEQVKIAWSDTRLMKFPKPYSEVTNIIVAGMGGSSLGGHIIQTACIDRLRAPLHLIRDYNLPKWVNSKTLVIVVSYSGNTEEAIEILKSAEKSKAKVVVVSTGGKMKRYVTKKKIVGYFFSPGDLSKQPRLGIGFTLVGVLGILERMKLIKVSAKDIRDIRSAMSDVLDTCALDIKSKDNPAKTVAKELKDRAILIVASEHLVGNAHALANQINESGKQFAISLEIPELNHHFMEGLMFPEYFFKKFTVLMFDSSLYHFHTRKRYNLTAQIFEKQGGEVIEYNVNGENRLEEVGEVLQFGSFVSYYLAMLNKLNPIGIPFVDWFKKEMKK